MSILVDDSVGQRGGGGDIKRETFFNSANLQINPHFRLQQIVNLEMMMSLLSLTASHIYKCFCKSPMSTNM